MPIGTDKLPASFARAHVIAGITMDTCPHPHLLPPPCRGPTEAVIGRPLCPAMMSH